MFSGFTASDFDAYAPKKWKSNVFTRERLEVKQKLQALGRAAAPSLLGVDGAPLSSETSAEYPALWNHKQVEAQHLFFSRNEAARKELDQIIDRTKSLASLIDDPTPLRNHVFLAVSISQTQLDIAVKLHPDARIDRENIDRKCDDHFERGKLLHMVAGLGAQYRIGITPDVTTVDLDDSALAALVKRLATMPAAPPLALAAPHLFYVGRAIAQSEVAALGADLVGVVQSTLESLLPVYRFIAWSRDNDYVLMREALQKEKQVKRQKGLAKNDQVRIVGGMFAGKTGVVQDIDGKGALKILVGKVAVKLDAKDVTKS